ncbi:MAG: hypothetical protein O3A00_20745 [Planctomycetota bacterium]|nr:hypothetical protein [Planctomycetota bacterium]
MSKLASTRTMTICVLAAMLAISHARLAKAAEPQSRVELALASAAKAKTYTFLLIYRTNDAATQSMYQLLKTELSERQNATLQPLQITDSSEQRLVDRFDATRLPLPATAAIAPNGAITGVFPQKLTSQQVADAIVSPGYAECLKAMQSKRIVLLCVQPEQGGFVPKGVQSFQADKTYAGRTQVVNIRATDPAEAGFLTLLKVRTDTASPVTVFMAPPGVLLGKYDSTVTHATLMNKLVAAGKCCDDKNCKHRQAVQSAAGSSDTRRQ